MPSMATAPCHCCHCLQLSLMMISIVAVSRETDAKSGREDERIEGSATDDGSTGDKVDDAL